MAEDRWNHPPVVKGVFYDDFSEGIRGGVWRALHEKWASQNNNGYSEDNCLYTTNAREVEKMGASGGIVVIRSNGDLSPQKERKRQGGGIVTKRLFGPGLYEARMKVVPRVGQCSAIWTYFNDWAPAMEDRKYSEIDVEMPHGGDYRKFSGTTYENYVNAEQKISSSQVVDCPVPLNDGKWHVFAFEWRTDRENGDEGIVWYLDGKPVLTIREAVPHYTATFWLASLFQDSPAWLGVPRFETAYMYVDWVRITEYADPCLPGFAEKESRLTYKGTDLQNAPIPKTDYIANGSFSHPARSEDFKGNRIDSWELDGGAQISEGVLRMQGKSRVTQTIEAQYAGFVFELCVDAEAAGEGRLEVYLESLSGKANTLEPVFREEGRSGKKICFTSGKRMKKRAAFRIEEKNTEHIRVVLETPEGTAANVYGVHMNLQSE